MTDRCYKLHGKEVVPVADMMEWARWMETADRHVAHEEIGQFHISTVFLGIDHNYFGGEPLLFETMVFGPNGHYLDQWQARCSTWDKAEDMHATAVALARETGRARTATMSSACKPMTASPLPSLAEAARELAAWRDSINGSMLYDNLPVLLFDALSAALEAQPKPIAPEVFSEVFDRSVGPSIHLTQDEQRVMRKALRRSGKLQPESEVMSHTGPTVEPAETELESAHARIAELEREREQYRRERDKWEEEATRLGTALWNLKAASGAFVQSVPVLPAASRSRAAERYPELLADEIIETIARADHKFDNSRDWYKLEPEEMDFKRRRARAIRDALREALGAK